MRNVLCRSEETITGTYSVGVFVFANKEQYGTAAIEVTLAGCRFGTGGAL